MQLSSGRLICWQRPELELLTTPWGQEKLGVTIHSQNTFTRQWSRNQLIGSSIFQSAVQGTARDFLAFAMIELERAGYEIINSIHDEVLLLVEEQSAEESPELWNTRPDLCCYLRKVAPLQNRLSTLDVWITGVRRQQAETRENVSVLELYQFDPLRDEYIYKLNPMAAWSRDKVQEFLKRHDIPQNALLSQGYRSIGCWPCTRPVAEGENERAGRWTGFDKKECGIHTFLPMAVTR